MMHNDSHCAAAQPRAARCHHAPWVLHKACAKEYGRWLYEEVVFEASRQPISPWEKFAPPPPLLQGLVSVCRLTRRIHVQSFPNTMATNGTQVRDPSESLLVI